MINEVSVKIPSQLPSQDKHISKISAYFDENFYHLSMNNIIESEKFEPEPIFEKTINEIKDIHLKSITSIAMNISDITSKKTLHLLNI